MNTEDLAMIEDHLRDVHEDRHKLEEWLNDVDLFVKDIIDLTKAAYETGFEYSREELIEAALKLKPFEEETE